MLFEDCYSEDDVITGLPSWLDQSVDVITATAAAEGKGGDGEKCMLEAVPLDAAEATSDKEVVVSAIDKGSFISSDEPWLSVDWIADGEAKTNLINASGHTNIEADPVRCYVEEECRGNEWEEGYEHLYGEQHIDRDEIRDAIERTYIFPDEEYVERDRVRAAVAIEKIREDLKRKREEFKRTQEEAAKQSSTDSTGDARRFTRRLRDNVKDGLTFLAHGNAKGFFSYAMY